MDGKTSPSRGRVLCVDDDQDTCDLFRVLLGALGYEVIATSNNNEAIGLARQRNLHLIILDSWLAEATGADLCKTIRGFDAQTPILFCSAAAFPADFEAAFAAGANAYLVKPYDSEELLAKIDQLIKGNVAMARTAPPDQPGGR
jgi:two-component system response regulator ResD